jgi:hypothetical protein
LVADGASTVVSRDSGSAGLGCAAEPNVTLQAVEGGSLSATGGANGAGIGADANGSCGSVTLANGSVSGKGATGIGSGWGQNGASSRVGALTVEGGEIFGAGTNNGCGLGSGRGYSGNLTVLRSVLRASLTFPIVYSSEMK